MNNNGEFEEVYILTPSQRREQERLRKEKEAEEAAQKRKREEAKSKKERQMRAHKSLYVLMISIPILCAISWFIFGQVKQYNQFLVFGGTLLLALPTKFLLKK